MWTVCICNVIVGTHFKRGPYSTLWTYQSPSPWGSSCPDTDQAKDSNCPDPIMLIPVIQIPATKILVTQIHIRFHYPDLSRSGSSHPDSTMHSFAIQIPKMRSSCANSSTVVPDDQIPSSHVPVNETLVCSVPGGQIQSSKVRVVQIQQVRSQSFRSMQERVQSTRSPK